MELVLDMSNPREKTMLLNQIRNLLGWHRFDILKYRRRRTDAQNRYYWPCFVGPFADMLRGQGEAVSELEAHEILKQRFLRKAVINQGTGEVLEYVRSTTELDVSEFNQYLDQCAGFLRELGVEVPDPSVYKQDEPDEPKQARPGYWRKKLAEGQE
jgi:hypothetical protein